MATISEKIKRAANRCKSTVILTREVLKFGSPAAVQAALKKLCEEGFLYRISQGVYAKTRPVPGMKDERVLADGLGGLAADALRKLGIKFDLGTLARAYRDGKTEQIPGKDIFEVFGRKIRRKIKVGISRVYYENNGRMEDQ